MRQVKAEEGIQVHPRGQVMNPFRKIVLALLAAFAFSALLAGAAAAAPFAITHFSNELTKSTRISGSARG